VDDTIKAQSEEQPAVESVVKEVPEQVAVAPMNNDSCTPSAQQMYNTPSQGVAPTHCRAHPL
jgi:hypothetical protein